MLCRRGGAASGCGGLGCMEGRCIKVAKLKLMELRGDDISEGALVVSGGCQEGLDDKEDFAAEGCRWCEGQTGHLWSVSVQLVEFHMNMGGARWACASFYYLDFCSL